MARSGSSGRKCRPWAMSPSVFGWSIELGGMDGFIDEFWIREKVRRPWHGQRGAVLTLFKSLKRGGHHGAASGDGRGKRAANGCIGRRVSAAAILRLMTWTRSDRRIDSAIYYPHDPDLAIRQLLWPPAAERFYTRLAPSPVAKPSLIALNRPLAGGWALTRTHLRDEGVAALAGNALPDGVRPAGAGLCRPSVRRLVAAAWRRTRDPSGRDRGTRRPTVRHPTERLRPHALFPHGRRARLAWTGPARIHRVRGHARAWRADNARASRRCHGRYRGARRHPCPAPS